MGNVVTRKSGRAAPAKEGRSAPTRPDTKATKLRSNAASFLRETWVELRWKTTWPNKQELVRFTAVVIAVVIIVAAYIGVADWVVANTTRLFYGS